MNSLGAKYKNIKQVMVLAIRAFSECFSDPKNELSSSSCTLSEKFSVIL